MKIFKPGSFDRWLTDQIAALDSGLDGKAHSSHTHTANQITDFNDAVDDRIDNLVNGAPAALDTLAEIAAALGDDEDFAGTMTTALSGKVDKVTGKALSENDFTNDYKSKLDGIATSATANSADSHLLSRTNHTGAQAISTVTGLQSALDAKALQTDLTALAARVTDLEAWKGAIKVARMEVFTVTTGSNGDFSITTSVAFTSPKIIGAVSATAGAEGYHAHVTGVSGTTITGRAFKNKTQGVLLGGTIDPDDPVASGTTIHVIVVQGS